MSSLQCHFCRLSDRTEFDIHGLYCRKCDAYSTWKDISGCDCHDNWGKEKPITYGEFLKAARAIILLPRIKIPK